MGEYTKSNETVKNKCSKMRVFDFFLTWFLGLVMVVAAIPHLENPYYFLGSVYSYNLMESGWGNWSLFFYHLYNWQLQYALFCEYMLIRQM
jgi:hypothetical protein